MREIMERLKRWFERRKDLQRFNKGRRSYEAEVGANLRYVENCINKRRERS